MSTWTYSGNPGNSGVDQVRFLIGDTKRETPMMLDGEIAWVLGEYNHNPLMAALRCCEVLIANSASMVDQSVGPASISLSQRIRNINDYVLPTLRRRVALEYAKPYAGGQSIVDKNANTSDQDLVQSQFDRRIFDPPSYSVGPIHHNADGVLYRVYGETT